MKHKHILHLIAGEDFQSAVSEITDYCTRVDCTRLDEVQAASEFLKEALITARSIRAHQSVQASQLASARAFLTPLLEPSTVNLLG